MLSSTRAILVAAFAVAIMALAVTAEAAKTSFIAVLNGAQEVPPTTSNAFGNAFLTFDAATGELCYAMSYTLEGVENAAHFHAPAAPGVDGGVVADISPPPDGPSPLGSPKQACVTLDKDAAKALKKGLVYVNIHTVEDTGGEIRGQVIPVKPKY